MTPTVISVENLSKTYRLGQIGSGTLTDDIRMWWARMRGLPNPLLKVGEKDYGNRQGEVLWALRDVSFTVEQGECWVSLDATGRVRAPCSKFSRGLPPPLMGW
jgi:lipopolysaccharide transport system ATP-binding protein